MTSINEQLAAAIKIAVIAHDGQIDIGGSPYILHPMRVAEKCFGKAKIVAWLHDTVEDTSITIDHLEAAGFEKEVITALKLLTRDKKQPYAAYIRGIRPNPIAREVKLADLTDNMDLTRLENIGISDIARRRKYSAAYHFLSQN